VAGNSEALMNCKLIYFKNSTFIFLNRNALLWAKIKVDSSVFNRVCSYTLFKDLKIKISFGLFMALIQK
jgi:hypothetical protein